MKPHDCWFCRLNRTLLVVGMLMMAAVCLVATLTDLFQAHWKMAGRGFIAVLFCIFMAWAGLKALNGIRDFWDWVFKGVADEEDDQKTV